MPINLAGSQSVSVSSQRPPVFGFSQYANTLSKISPYYKFFETSSLTLYPPPLPSAPSEKEKYSYLKRHVNVLTFFSILGFACITISASRLYVERVWLYPFFLLLGYTIFYFLFSLRINLFPQDFDVENHKRIVAEWKPNNYPHVDVFLPTCGEPIEVLKNTWDGITELKSAYGGVVNVYCLDDAHSHEVKILAHQYGFHYHARPNKGWFKKAGNLRHGFENSSGDFIAIFDADFRPRHDFLNEMLPYFYRDVNLGIVQSPQYFEVSDKQNWLERGAGAVQEFFYRAIQVSRQTHGGAICVGSNAIYRRKALQDIGGTALIEHSEDVHTGFELRRKGWHLLYIPVVLAKGLCPSELKAFFKQQYRWCMGSMSLLTSRGFWNTKLALKTRMCYGCGFMYYIHTAIYTIFTPVVPLVMLFALPDEIKLINYLLIFPSFVYMHIVYPLWHRATYGIETASVKLVYGWAHLFALIDRIANKAMEWHPTGAAHKKDGKYSMFRVGVVVFNLIPATAWVMAGFWYALTWDTLDFLPIFLLGIYYFCTVIKVVLYKDVVHKKSEPETGVLQGERALEVVA